MATTQAPHAATDISVFMEVSNVSALNPHQLANMGRKDTATSSTSTFTEITDVSALKSDRPANHASSATSTLTEMSDITALNPDRPAIKAGYKASRETAQTTSSLSSISTLTEVSDVSALNPDKGSESAAKVDVIRAAYQVLDPNSAPFAYLQSRESLGVDVHGVGVGIAGRGSSKRTLISEWDEAVEPKGV